VLKQDGTVAAWGDPSGGGPGGSVPPDLRNVVAIAASYHQNIAARGDGTVVVWGSDPGLNNVPAGLSNVISVAAVQDANLALLADGSLVAWGYGAATTNIPPGLTNIIAISGGYANFIALSADGSVAAWGDDSNYQTNIPSGLSAVGAVAAGNGHCLVLSGGAAPVSYQPPFSVVALAESSVLFESEAYAPGAFDSQWIFYDTNLSGATLSTLLLTNVQLSQSGPYALVSSNAAGSVKSLVASLSVVPLFVGVQPTNQLLYSGDTLSAAVQGPGPWSFQWYFQGRALSGETNSNLRLANLVTNQPGAYSVVVSNSYGSVVGTAAVFTVVDSLPIILAQPTNVASWPGASACFQVAATGSKPLSYQWLFNGSDIPGATNSALWLTNLTFGETGLYSVRVRNFIGPTLSSNATLAVLNLVTWGGTNSYGLGAIPPNLTNTIAAAGGISHSVALKADGRVVAWGYNYYNQTNVPPGLSNVIAVAAGGYHNLALKTDGTVVSWGDMTTVPAGLSNVVMVSAGDAHSLALRSDGTVVAWGANGTATNVPSNLSNAVAIAAGGSFSAALKSDGTVVTWGTAPSTNGMTNIIAIAASEYPLVGLKGDGTVVAPSTGTVPSSLTNAIGVAAARYIGLALRADGTVASWSSTMPVPPTLINVQAVTCGQNHCLAVTGAGPPVVRVPAAGLKRSSNKFSLTLPTQSGHVYVLEYINSITASNWTALPLVAGTGGMLTLTDPTATSAQRYYRVRQW
jgi:alpha-tubulin suppressor-like RCC1 family protein